MKLLLSALLLSGCGAATQIDNLMNEKQLPKVNKSRPDITGDNDLHSIVDLFYSDIVLKGKTPDRTVDNIQMADESLFKDKDGMVGFCQQYTQGFQIVKGEVRLDQAFWDTATYETKRLLVYHELGHCVLDLSHTAQDSETIMQPILMSDGEINSIGWDNLVDQEFNTK